FMAADGADFLVDRPFGNASATESSLLIEDHGSTHLDPLVHVWWGNCTYNNYPAPEIISQSNGVIKGSSNAYIPRSFTRGVLIDVARFLDMEYVDKIEGGVVLTPDMIEKIATAEKVKITPGTALLIRTGWLKRWTGVKPEWAMEDGQVGISCGIEKWLQEKQIALIGADNVALEAFPSSSECNNAYQISFLPMHIGVLSMLGVPFVELMDLDALSEDCARDGVYEFAFSFAPFRYHNASGGLVSPTAIK
ncbi:MAG: cyclase family protein, partial [Desulfobacterales bacterium]